MPAHPVRRVTRHTIPIAFFCLTLSVPAGLLAAAGEPEKPAKVEKKPAPAEAKPKEEADAPAKAKGKAKGKADPADAKPKPGGDGGNIHVVRAAPLSVKTKVSGVVESTRQTPIAFDLERWTDLVVVDAVPHGTTVKEGDTLLEIDTEALEKKIKELSEGMPLKDLEMQAAELELEKLEKSTPISLETARRGKMHAEEDLAYFEDVTRPMRERGAEEDLKSVTEYLAYAAEELAQLEKMYKQDDLTEETEEIILRRARNSVHEATWRKEQTEERVKRTLETTIPREHENLQSSLELHEINWRAGEKSMRDALEKKQLEVAAKRRETEEAKRSLEEYEKDLAGLTVKAPHAGIVYHGQSQRGKWITAATVERKLLPGGKLLMREIVMTVADPRKLQLRLSVPEDKLKDLAAGQNAGVTLKWNAEKKLTGKVNQVSHVPLPDDNFDCVVSLGAPEGIQVYPGMKADAEITVYDRKEALTVPKRAIRKDGDTETVELEGGKKVKVETGRTQGDKVEIVKGLEAGARVVLPEEEKKEAEPEKKDEEKKDEKK